MLLQSIKDGRVRERDQSSQQRNKEVKIARLTEKYDSGELTAVNYVIALSSLMASK